MKVEIGNKNGYVFGTFDSWYFAGLFVNALMRDYGEDAGDYDITINMHVIPEDTDIQLYIESLEKQQEEEKKEPEFIKELDIEEDFEAKRKQAVDKILKKDEEARLKISEELSTQTAAEAMASMKAAVDNLEIPKKPKKRSKDTSEKILNRYNQGYTKAKMAEELGIGISTVNYHLQKLRDEGKI